MELVQLTDTAYYLRGGTNAGLIVCDKQAVVVDTGLDRDTAKKILRSVDSLGVRLAGVVVTHAHADHFGGAAVLRARTGAPVYAPAFEAAIIANPLLEPLYLFSGASPPADLRHKFTLADACPVDATVEPGEVTIGGITVRVIAAPGHAPNQVMIASGDVCFVADACFAPEILAKHGIPFYFDVAQTGATLTALSALDGTFAAFVPGHGAAVPRIGPWANENGARLDEIREAVWAALDHAGEPADILRLVAERLNVTIPNAVIYWLMQTTVLACLSAAEATGSVRLHAVENRLRWEKVV
jgi:glyoxylase-like metal-dependent hydrolase (beta-lactamase superfamily II)